MRIATLNTWGTRGDWPACLEMLRAEFERIDADVLTLQETVLTAEIDQAALMLGGGYHYAQQSVREDGSGGAVRGQGITTASRWPIGEVIEVDLNVTDRTGEFACTCLITEILAPAPLGRLWVANHFPDYQLDHERERCL
ncbi:endonuclease/exonuclease/phosphatase family protein [Brachybacterium sp. GCM10030252]|uniref:endonuclease/exonuclease/phosphatase family protein n=1 Tax=Brachybacterium sp. GCM10030252 TaxID=3273380 RepID=UPI00360A3B5B